MNKQIASRRTLFEVSEEFEKRDHYLGIPTQHYVHLGRVLGSVLAEADGDDNELIRILGNRDPKIQDKAYSSKLPMKSIRSRELALEATEVSITMLGQLSSPQANYFLRYFPGLIVPRKN
ncbi:hypothetical protein IV203_034396 [Nitzschia inconspicua]|uniref:Uncharacterized protein n=1 Tax=Nitzschia inconspicua TaxID=303405 RepID=A0A9K3M4C9_9STRA|nr:hypothetical protein IV203_034396 [Nitzschia inconspicua]